jgi:hypothetical protein
MGKIKTIAASIVAAAAATLATGLVKSTPAQLVGATWYGYPTTWLRKLVIAPQYNPWKVDVTGLIIDLIVWFVVFVAIISVAGYLAGKRTNKN